MHLLCISYLSDTDTNIIIVDDQKCYFLFIIINPNGIQNSWHQYDPIRKPVFFPLLLWQSCTAKSRPVSATTYEEILPVLHYVMYTCDEGTYITVGWKELWTAGVHILRVSSYRCYTAYFRRDSAVEGVRGDRGPLPSTPTPPPTRVEHEKKCRRDWKRRRK